MMNMFREPLDFEWPPVRQRAWHLAIDTFSASPDDIAVAGRERPIASASQKVQARSIVVLVGTSFGRLVLDVEFSARAATF